MIRYGWLFAVAGMLTGCGTSTGLSMKVACTSGTSVEPLARFEIRQIPAIGSNPPTAALFYPDPLHHEQTGTLTLAPGEKCTVTTTKS